MRLTSLADACHAAGLIVVEHDGWQDRGRDLGQVGAVLAHHTATAARTSDQGVCRLLIDGRPDLPGPLCQIGLDRSGRVHLIAAGQANHAGAGSWRGVSGNSRAIGVEAFNDGIAEPWHAAQLEAWDRLNAALLRLLNLPAEALCGHKEWAPARKIDPRGLDMDQMRARAAHLLDEEDPMAGYGDVLSDIQGHANHTRVVADIMLEEQRQQGATLTALEAAVRALAASKGASGDDVVEAVRAEVRAALERGVTLQAGEQP